MASYIYVCNTSPVCRNFWGITGTATSFHPGRTADAENRLISYEPAVSQTGENRVRFAYDYQGRRVRKTVEEYDPNAGWTPGADTAYVWDGWKLLLEIDLRDPNDLAGGEGVRPAVDCRGGVGLRPASQPIAAWGLDLAGQNGQSGSIGISPVDRGSIGVSPAGDMLSGCSA